MLDIQTREDILNHSIIADTLYSITGVKVGPWG